MPTLEEYLLDPCACFSIPYWKYVRGGLPDNIKVLRERDLDVKADRERSMRYFRLIHRLKGIKAQPVEGFRIYTAQSGDTAILADIINRSYSYLSVECEQLEADKNTSVYDPKLWVIVCEETSGLPAACGIADYDPIAREGILEWIQVLPEYRRRGLGRMLVTELLLRMKEADFATVSGMADDPARPELLYRSCGFEGNDIWCVMRP